MNIKRQRFCLSCDLCVCDLSYDPKNLEKTKKIFTKTKISHHLTDKFFRRNTIYIFDPKNPIP